jgi:hypothetical protein
LDTLRDFHLNLLFNKPFRLRVTHSAPDIPSDRLNTGEAEKLLANLFKEEREYFSDNGVRSIALRKEGN